MTKQISPLRRSMIDHTIFLSVSSGIPGEPVSAAACLAGALASFRRLERINAYHPTRPSARVVVNGSLGSACEKLVTSICFPECPRYLPEASPPALTSSANCGLWLRRRD